MLAIFYFITLNLQCHITSAIPISSSTTIIDGHYIHGQRHIDALPDEKRFLDQISTDEQTVKNLASVNRLINLSNLNVSLNNNKLKGYKLRELFSKISINGSDQVSHENGDIIDGKYDLNSHLATNNYTIMAKNRNRIEVISVDLMDADIPLTLPATTLDSAIRMFAPNVPETHLIKFTQNHLTMTGINLKLLTIQLYKENDPKCDVQFIVSNTTINGLFSFDTQVMLVDVRLKGGYTMQINDVHVKASTKVTKEIDADNNSAPRLRTKDLDLNITSIGRINLNLYEDDDSDGDDNNYWFRLMNRVLHKTIKRTYYMFEKEIKRTLEEASRKTLNDELAQMESYLSSNTSQQQDLVASVRQEMIESNYVSTELPDYQYSNRLLGFETRINFTKGILSDIDTIKITGDSKMKIQDLHLLINTSVGWSELIATYDWRLNLGIKGKVKFIIKEVGDSTLEIEYSL